jgi:hypothetical protein
MIKAIKSAFATLATTLRFVAGAGARAIYPVVAFILVVSLALLALTPMLAALVVGPATPIHYVVLAAGIYFAYVLFYLVTAYSTVAFLAETGAGLDGAAPAAGMGLCRALRRTPLVLAFVAKAASIDVIAFLARTFIGPIFGMVIAPAAAKTAWSKWKGHSYDVPMSVELASIALEPQAPTDTYRHAEKLIAGTWGNAVKPARSLGLLGLLVLLPIMAFVAMPYVQQGMVAHDGRLELGLAVMLLAIGTFATLSLLSNALLGLAAWRYAMRNATDTVPGEPDYGRHAFVPAKFSRKASKPVTAARDSESIYSP